MCCVVDDLPLPFPFRKCASVALVVPGGPVQGGGVHPTMRRSVLRCSMVLRRRNPFSDCSTSGIPSRLRTLLPRRLPENDGDHSQFGMTIHQICTEDTLLSYLHDERKNSASESVARLYLVSEGVFFSYFDLNTSVCCTISSICERRVCSVCVLCTAQVSLMFVRRLCIVYVRSLINSGGSCGPN